MKKTVLIFVPLVFLLLACVSTGDAGNNNQQINSDILGEIFTEKNGGFSMYIPKGWELKDMNQKYLMPMGQAENDFTANINFGDDQYSGPLSDFGDAVIEYLKKIYTELDVVQKENFVTNSGLKGECVTLLGQLNKINVRQRMYLIQNKAGTMVMAITGTAAQESGTKYDSVFDECVKTFSWTK